MGLGILIVDDHESIAKTFAKLLKTLGHKTSIAHSGKAALKKMQLKKPDIVLLDIRMPEMNGYAVAKNIRSDEKFSETILIALTGHRSVDDKLKAREAGFNHHIEKPASLDEIKRVINIYDY